MYGEPVQELITGNIQGAVELENTVEAKPEVKAEKTYLKHTYSTNLPTIDPLLFIGLPTGLQPDCHHWLHTVLLNVLFLIFLLSSFRSRTKLAFTQFLVTRK